MPKTLDEMLQPGNKVRQFWNEGNINNALLHVRAIVDDDYIVTKEWWQGKRHWHYKMEHRTWYEMLHKDGVLTYAGRSDA